MYHYTFADVHEWASENRHVNHAEVLGRFGLDVIGVYEACGSVHVLLHEPVGPTIRDVYRINFGMDFEPSDERARVSW
jgi:hypothetical protein